MNTQKCKNCAKYQGSMRPLRNKKGGHITLRQGHCLERTVYATNRPGDEVLPPGAKTAELPFGQHKIHLVRAENVESHCSSFTQKRS